MASSKTERKRRRLRLRDPAAVKFKYRPQYGVIAICTDEPHQSSIYELLRKMKLECKVVVV